jgi:hypothetical protein
MKFRTATMGDESLHYRSYVLRCWAEYDRDADMTLWRFSLEDTCTGQRRGFASLNKLMTALRTELNLTIEVSDDPFKLSKPHTTHRRGT